MIVANNLKAVIIIMCYGVILNYPQKSEKDKKKGHDLKELYDM